MRCIPLLAGEESGSATKTYLNTLITLYAGLGFDGLELAIECIADRMEAFEETGRQLAERLHQHLSTGCCKGLTVVGSGPNWGTALQAALILSECSKFVFTGMSLSQYDHGPKETAHESFVIALLADGPARARTKGLLDKVESFGALTYILEEKRLAEALSPLALIIPLNFAAAYLARALGETIPFQIGGKVTVAE
jgi:glucosamine--fructose-6-phosphate aminotransferase (isomerizing)